jgi:hypothetical protein
MNGEGVLIVSIFKVGVNDLLEYLFRYYLTPRNCKYLVLNHFTLIREPLKILFHKLPKLVTPAWDQDSFASKLHMGRKQTQLQLNKYFYDLFKVAGVVKMEMRRPLKLVSLLFMFQLLAIIFITNVTRERVTAKLGGVYSSKLCDF